MSARVRVHSLGAITSGPGFEVLNGFMSDSQLNSRPLGLVRSWGASHGFENLRPLIWKSEFLEKCTAIFEGNLLM